MLYAQLSSNPWGASSANVPCLRAHLSAAGSLVRLETPGIPPAHVEDPLEAQRLLWQQERLVSPWEGLINKTCRWHHWCILMPDQRQPRHGTLRELQCLSSKSWQCSDHDIMTILLQGNDTHYCGHHCFVEIRPMARMMLDAHCSCVHLQPRGKYTIVCWHGNNFYQWNWRAGPQVSICCLGMVRDRWWSGRISEDSSFVLWHSRNATICGTHSASLH